MAHTHQEKKRKLVCLASQPWLFLTHCHWFHCSWNDWASPDHRTALWFATIILTSWLLYLLCHFFCFRHVWKHAFNVHVPLFRYYDQLCAVEPKFPFSENQVIELTPHVFVGWLRGKWVCKRCLSLCLQLCLTFTWKDAFDKGSLFGGSVKLGKSCILSLQHAEEKKKHN